MSSYHNQLTKGAGSIYATALKSAHQREEILYPTPIKSYADFTEKYLGSTKTKLQSGEYGKVGGNILGTGMGVKSISTKDLGSALGHHSYGNHYQPHSLYLRENKLGLSKSKDLSGSKSAHQQSNNQFFNHSWTRVKLEHFQDQQKKIIDKIQVELKKRGISDPDLATDIKFKSSKESVSVKKFRETADITRVVEVLERENKENERTNKTER